MACNVCLQYHGDPHLNDQMRKKIGRHQRVSLGVIGTTDILSICVISTIGRLSKFAIASAIQLPNCDSKISIIKK